MKKIDKIISKLIREATADGTISRGGYIPPIQPGLRPWNKEDLGAYTDPVSDFKSPLVQYDSYDHKMGLKKKDIQKLEKTASKIQNYMKNHPNATNSDEDGNVVNQFMYDGKNPKKNVIMRPFTEKVPFNEWTEVSDNLINKKPIKITKKRINEDLAVWFGTKKKPKGSKQPKGPWVNICRKVDGKHPPCGRPDTDKGGYPKCRAAGVAGKMSDSEKKSACQQKRTAEKKDTQTGKGQKPIMTSYKPKKK